MQMSWTPSGYKQIVYRHGVELVGWTEPEMVNPGNLSGDKLDRLHLAQKEGRCRWVLLSEEEWDIRRKDFEEMKRAGRVTVRGRKKAPTGNEVGGKDQSATSGHAPSNDMDASCSSTGDRCLARDREE